MTINFLIWAYNQESIKDVLLMKSNMGHTSLEIIISKNNYKELIKKNKFLKDMLRIKGELKNIIKELTILSNEFINKMKTENEKSDIKIIIGILEKLATNININKSELDFGDKLKNIFPNEILNKFIKLNNLRNKNFEYKKFDRLLPRNIYNGKEEHISIYLSYWPQANTTQTASPENMQKRNLRQLVKPPDDLQISANLSLASDMQHESEGVDLKNLIYDFRKENLELIEEIPRIKTGNSWEKRDKKIYKVKSGQHEGLEITEATYMEFSNILNFILVRKKFSQRLVVFDRNAVISKDFNNPKYLIDMKRKFENLIIDLKKTTPEEDSEKEIKRKMNMRIINSLEKEQKYLECILDANILTGGLPPSNAVSFPSIGLEGFGLNEENIFNEWLNAVMPTGYEIDSTNCSWAVLRAFSVESNPYLKAPLTRYITPITPLELIDYAKKVQKIVYSKFEHKIKNSSNNSRIPSKNISTLKEFQTMTSGTKFFGSFNRSYNANLKTIDKFLENYEQIANSQLKWRLKTLDYLFDSINIWLYQKENSIKNNKSKRHEGVTKLLNQIQSEKDELMQYLLKGDDYQSDLDLLFNPPQPIYFDLQPVNSQLITDATGLPAKQPIWKPSFMPSFPDEILSHSYVRINKKTGGQASKSEHEGLYKLNNTNHIILFKQGRNDGETICEYLASQIYELIIPGYAAKVFLAKPKKSSNTELVDSMKELHTEIYVGTVFFEGFKEIHHLMGFEERPKFLQTRYAETSSDFIKKFKSSNLGEILAASLWVGDYDVHIGNLGVAGWGDKMMDTFKKWDGKTNTNYWNNTRFVKIDHGWSFADLENKMDRFSTPWSHTTPIGKPTNHYNDYNYHNFYTDPSGGFCKTVNRLKEKNYEAIKKNLENAFLDINKFYGQIGSTSLSVALKSTAKWIGCPDKKDQNKIIEYLAEKLYQRAINGVKEKNKSKEKSTFVTRQLQWPKPIQSWMGAFHNQLYVSDLTIPGTHESCSTSNRLNVNMFNCQTGDIPMQLNAGIRFLDLRCHIDKDKIGLSHGGADMYIKLDEVLMQCKNFITENPSEFIFIKVKKENNKVNFLSSFGVGTKNTSNDKFGLAFLKCIHPYKDMFYLKSKIPKLCEVRGKIILISDKGLSGCALDWNNKNIFEKQGIWEFQFTQNSQEKKWGLIEKFLRKTKYEYLDNAKDENDNVIETNMNMERHCIYINAMNASGSMNLNRTPKFFSDYLNPKLLSYLEAKPIGPYGIITMDFVLENSGPELIKRIIEANQHLLNNKAIDNLTENRLSRRAG